MNKADVIDKLRSAFDGAANGRPPLSREDAVHMRGRIIMMRPDDVPYYLSCVLREVLESYSGTRKGMEDVEILVDYLDVPTRVEKDLISSHYGESEVAYEMKMAGTLRQTKLAGFQSITKDQAAAIHDWLALVIEWRVLVWEEESARSAMEYWRVRKESVGEGGSPQIPC